MLKSCQTCQSLILSAFPYPYSTKDFILFYDALQLSFVIGLIRPLSTSYRYNFIYLLPELSRFNYILADLNSTLAYIFDFFIALQLSIISTQSLTIPQRLSIKSPYLNYSNPNSQALHLNQYDSFLFFSTALSQYFPLAMSNRRLSKNLIRDEDEFLNKRPSSCIVIYVLTKYYH